MTKAEELEIKQLSKRLNDLYAIQLEERYGVRPVNYRGPIPRPKCNCEGWGCFGCCETEQEIRSRQGIYS